MAVPLRLHLLVGQLTDTSSTLTFGRFIFYRPKAVPIFITLSLVSLCLFLGIWQVQRLAWKENLIVAVEKNRVAPPLTMQELPQDLSQLKDQLSRHIELSGQFQHRTEFHAIGRHETGGVGYHVLTPFKLEGDGRMVLVDRGWVPTAKKEAANRPEDPRPTETVTVKGSVMVPGKPRFIPDNDTVKNVWLWDDTETMASLSGLSLPPVVIRLINLDAPENILPIPASEAGQLALRNDHLNYAIIWFSLAFSGMVIFVLSHRKPAA